MARGLVQVLACLTHGLGRMQELGRISAGADPTRLAYLLLSAFQGGMLLAQVARDITPLKEALQAAIDYVQTFATPLPSACLEIGSRQPGSSG